MNHTPILILCLALAACSSGPPCLANGEPARVDRVAPITSDARFVSVKFTMNDRTKRICVLGEYDAALLAPGDVVRGPLLSNNWQIIR